jgi:hypothetical protein
MPTVPHSVPGYGLQLYLHSVHNMLLAGWLAGWLISYCNLAPSLCKQTCRTHCGSLLWHTLFCSSQDESVAPDVRGKYLAFVPERASQQPGQLTHGLQHLAGLRKVSQVCVVVDKFVQY